MERSIADFVHACEVEIERISRDANGDNAVLALLCDAVRLSREHVAYVTRSRKEALRYIDGWIENKFAQNLTPGARAILGDMQIHILAAIERIDGGLPMQSLTPLMDTKESP